jgi:tetrahydromethanopterin S-methyltransferase subunit H
MLNFNTPQKVHRIGNIKIGGQPGENPAVLIGSLFYHGHKVVTDEQKGEFDKNAVQTLIALQEEYSDKTKNPCMIDIVGASEDSIRKYIDYISSITETPFLIDSPSPEVKVAGARHAADVGLLERSVYNSLLPTSTQSELDTVRDLKLENAVLLAYNTGFMNSADRVETIRGLYQKATEIGVKKPIVDTFVIDVPTLSMASKAAIEIKKEMGLPCGCGAHNAISTWAGFKKRMGQQAYTPCMTVANTMPIILGADFILYGPIKSCEYVFPAASALYSSYRYMRKTGDTIFM